MAKKNVKKVKKGSGSRKQDLLVQEEGKLMLNNPLIPPELDEDIDDDIAFNSDDERMYGSFFAKKTEKGSGKEKKGDANDLYNYREEGQSSGDDNEYINLEDMLDINLKEEEAKKSKGRAKVQSETGMKVLKKKRSSTVIPQDETLFSEHEHNASFNTTLRSVLRTEKKNSNAAASRLEQALESKSNLISVDVDEKTKDAITRKKVREITEENMKKYKPILRELQTKRMQLPMPAPESNPVPSSIGAIAATSIGKTELGETDRTRTSNKLAALQLAGRMADILSHSGLSSNTEETPNDILGSKKFSNEQQEEVPSIQYMSKLKSMLSYENSRRKRLNKIKSKTYRRILRKEKDREKEKRQKAFELLHPELARKRLAEKLTRARAEERVTQKHKNTSAWVKHAKRFSHFDEQAKDAINEQLSIHQKLMQKMEEDAGEENYSRYIGEQGNEESEEEDMVVDELLSSSPSDLKGIASKIWSSIESDAPGATPAISKARQDLREMKFMKNAEARELKQVTDELRALKEDVEKTQSGDKTSARKGETAKPSRLRFSQEKHEVENILLAGDDNNSSPKVKIVASSETDQVSGEVEKSEFAGCRANKAAKSARVRIRPGEDVSIGVKRASPDTKTPEAQESSLSTNQTYLVARAFAEDDVDEDFKKEKEAQVELIMKPEDRNKNLPGWGEWGGEDERLNKRHQEKLEHSLFQKNVQKTFLQKSRADAALDHVVINHDGVELVPDRMTLHMVPRPFSNPKEFARSLRQPVGPEWTSALSFKDFNQPRVEVKQGHAVVPLDLSLRSEKAKTKRRKVEASHK